MGLSMTLPKDKNPMYYEFKDAYWAVDQVIYTTDLIDFRLVAYPNREAKLMDYNTLENPSIGCGSANGAGTVSCGLYTWHVTTVLTDVFTDGSIPTGRDAQYTVIYNWIKNYTGLPFKDVLED